MDSLPSIMHSVSESGGLIHHGDPKGPPNGISTALIKHMPVEVVIDGDDFNYAMLNAPSGNYMKPEDKIKQEPMITIHGYSQSDHHRSVKCKIEKTVPTENNNVDSYSTYSSAIDKGGRNLQAPKKPSFSTEEDLEIFGLDRLKLDDIMNLYIRINEANKIRAFIRIRLSLIFQQWGKKIAKLWIKGICKKKQALFPYQNKNRTKITGQALEIPQWWPAKDVCEFVEPDHIGRMQRINLLAHLLRLRPSVEQLREWNKGLIEPSQVHTKYGWTAFLRSLAPPDSLDEPEQIRKGKHDNKALFLKEVYEIAQLEENFVNGRIGSDSIFTWTIRPDELTILNGGIGGKKRTRDLSEERLGDVSSVHSKATKRAKHHHRETVSANIDHRLLSDFPAKGRNEQTSIGNRNTNAASENPSIGSIYQPLQVQEHRQVMHSTWPPVAGLQENAAYSDLMFAWRNKSCGTNDAAYTPLYMGGVSCLKEATEMSLPSLPNTSQAYRLPIIAEAQLNSPYLYTPLSPLSDVSGTSQSSTAFTNSPTSFAPYNTLIPDESHGNITTTFRGIPLQPTYNGAISSIQSTEAYIPASPHFGFSTPLSRRDDQAPELEDPTSGSLYDSMPGEMFKEPASLPSAVVRGFTGHGSGVGGGAAT